MNNATLERDGAMIQPTKVKRGTTFRMSLQCEKGLPPMAATGEQLAEYQRQHIDNERE